MENNNTQPEFVFRKEREFGEIISDTFSFFSQNRKVLTNIFLKFIGPFILLAVVGNTFYQYKTGDLFTDLSVFSGNPDIVFSALGDNLLVLLFFILTSVITSIVLYATVLHSIKSYIKNNGEILESEVSAGIKKNFFSILLLTILIGLVAGIGFLFCFLPGVYLAVVLSPGIAVLVMEDISVTDAFSKCFSLIKDNWWITFATILVFTILISILSFVFQIPAFIYTFVESFAAAESIQESGSPEAFAAIYQNWVYLLFTAIGVIGQYFLSTFSVIMIALVYFNLSEKKEFSGTYNQIDQIGN